jgi:hypothetical protein
MASMTQILDELAFQPHALADNLGRAGMCRTSASAASRTNRTGVGAMALTLVLGASGCTETYDAGASRPHGLLPVDERNPIVLCNDSSYDNWQGEYAILLANGGGPGLAGIVIGRSPNANDIDANIADWRTLVGAARASGIENIPDPIATINSPLVRPARGVLDETEPSRSEGALFIVDESARLSLPYRPLVVVTGGRLTDVASAYLIDPTVTERVVVVSQLGTTSGSGATMGPPNGEMDPWADAIVTARFRYIQVSTFYDQLTDVPAARVSELPANAFGKWIAAKQPGIWNNPLAADQCAVAAVGIPAFVTAVERVAAAGALAANATTGPNLTPDPTSAAWLVTGSDGTAATRRFWQLLLDPATFQN